MSDFISCISWICVIRSRSSQKWPLLTTWCPPVNQQIERKLRVSSPPVPAASRCNFRSTSTPTSTSTSAHRSFFFFSFYNVCSAAHSYQAFRLVLSACPRIVTLSISSSSIEFNPIRQGHLYLEIPAIRTNPTNASTPNTSISIFQPFPFLFLFPHRAWGWVSGWR